MIKSQTMETSSDICKQFHAIAESELPVPDSTLQRKTIVSVRKRKISLFTATTETSGSYADG